MKCQRPVRKNQGIDGSTFRIDHPCGTCMPCRVTRQQQWVTRILLEDRCHAFSSFITLTYSPEHLPDGNALVKSDLQKFIKRLRKNTGQKFRYVAVGEYGDERDRPHYHAILFGYDPIGPDGMDIKSGRANRELTLEKTWGKGFCTIEPLTPGRARYTAAYTMKKLTKERDDGRPPEFALHSRRPGIGHNSVGILANAFKKKNSHLASDDFSSSHIDNSMGLTTGLVRIEGKKWLLDKYMRNQISQALGASERSSTGKALRKEMKIVSRMRDPELAETPEELELRIRENDRECKKRYNRRFKGRTL